MNSEDWQVRYDAAAERERELRAEVLRAAGVSIPDPYVPYEPTKRFTVKPRPKWLAFLYRLYNLLGGAPRYYHARYRKMRLRYRRRGSS